MKNGSGVFRAGGRASVALLAALVVVAGAGSAEAQVMDQGASGATYGTSILGLLPVTAQVAVGSQVEGALTDADFTTVTGVRVKAYELNGAQGDPVTIDLMSDELDAYLYLVGPGYDEPLTDDDAGGACNARLNAFLPEDGPYLLVVGSLSGETGDFTLRVDSRGHPVSDGDCYGGDEGGGLDFEASLYELEIEGTLEVDVPITDSLTTGFGEIADGSFARAWWYLGVPGETVTLDLISEDFDAMLFVIEDDGDGFWSDDDSGGACNSRITLEIESEEPYRIIVNSIRAVEGAFTLRLTENPEPPGAGPCMGM